MACTLVADIGGTSSRWGVLSDGNGPRIIEGLPGFNPAVGDPGALLAALKERIHAPGIEVEDIYAYGAGCGSVERSTRLAEVLLAVFPHARIDVASDLMGAAHGLLGSGSGLVLILGTGMNAGYFDGVALQQPMPSLGYILGDEGSGADIGKHFLHDALHGHVPEPVLDVVFPERIPLPGIIERLYRGTDPQAWLASFAGKLAAVRSETYVQALLERRFRALTELLALHFDRFGFSAMHATGSVAHGFQQELAAALKGKGYALSGVEPSPLPGLLRYRSRSRR